MTFAIKSSVALALLLGLASGNALAKEKITDEVCSQRVAKLCGDASVAQCFTDETKWNKIGSECEGTVQMLIENENDANNAQNQITAEGMDGIAYGGILRKGAGMEEAKKASLQRGDKIHILEDPGIWMDDYKWFKVKTPKGVGYLWGGIFCIPGDVLPEGVLDNCQLLNQ